ncbi:MAG TPA: hypothetical protein VI819_04580 [Patescibacteria group bacterium]|nr:hypothetical protein [Patescibacteria group bacterium]
MDGVQVLLTVVVVVLTGLLVIVGIQVVLVIIDLRRGLKKLNSLLDDSLLGGGLIRPDKITGILEMFRKKKNVEKRGEY